jgi:hypothetical protein
MGVDLEFESEAPDVVKIGAKGYSQLLNVVRAFCLQTMKFYCAAGFAREGGKQGKITGN